jgi:hypothetical protein
VAAKTRTGATTLGIINNKKMEATLKFTLPEEQDEFENAKNGNLWQLMVWEFDQYLRENIKYAPDGTHDERHKAFEDIRDMLHEKKNNFGLKLD